MVYGDLRGVWLRLRFHVFDGEVKRRVLVKMRVLVKRFPISDF